MKRVYFRGKIKFVYKDEKRRLKKSSLPACLKGLEASSEFIKSIYATSDGSSYLSVLRSDSKDVPDWLNIDEYQIVSHPNLTNRSFLLGPYKTMPYHHTTPEKLKKTHPYIILSA